MEILSGIGALPSYARGFAGHYPKEVTGLVFIDPADSTETEECWNDIFWKMGLPEKKIDEMLQNPLMVKKAKYANQTLAHGVKGMFSMSSEKPILLKSQHCLSLMHPSIFLCEVGSRFRNS